MSYGDGIAMGGWFSKLFIKWRGLFLDHPVSLSRIYYAHLARVMYALQRHDITKSNIMMNEQRPFK